MGGTFRHLGWTRRSLKSAAACSALVTLLTAHEARAQRVQVQLSYGYAPSGAPIGPVPAPPVTPPASLPPTTVDPSISYAAGGAAYAQYLAYVAATQNNGAPPPLPSRSDANAYFTNGAQATSIPTDGPSAAYFTNGAEGPAPMPSTTQQAPTFAAPAASAVPSSLAPAPYPTINAGVVPAPPPGGPAPYPIAAPVVVAPAPPASTSPAAPAPQQAGGLEAVPQGVLDWIASVTRAEAEPPPPPAAAPVTEVFVVNPPPEAAAVLTAPSTPPPSATTETSFVMPSPGPWTAKVPAPQIGSNLALGAIAFATGLFVGATALVRRRSRAAAAAGPSLDVVTPEEVAASVEPHEHSARF